MRVALCIIILFLGLIIGELEIISTNGLITPLGLLAGLGWAGLLHDYLESKKRGRKE